MQVRSQLYGASRSILSPQSSFSKAFSKSFKEKLNDKTDEFLSFEDEGIDLYSVKLPPPTPIFLKSKLELSKT